MVDLYGLLILNGEGEKAIARAAPKAELQDESETQPGAMGGGYPGRLCRQPFHRGRPKG